MLVNSYGGIIYKIKDWQPYFLVLKRQAFSKKIEWTAPKWKSKTGEQPIQTAKREIFEETGLKPDLLNFKTKLGDFIIEYKGENFYKKKVTYFLFEYKWNFSDVNLTNTEGYIWVYNWLTIDKVINLIAYQGLRELYRKAYFYVINKLRKWDFEK
jgi:8-oxo-dGTP pyrophosphatase MutT (NUDIX family)